MEKRVKFLNGTFEVALRLLAILTTCKISMTIERLAAYSYFALYLSDLDKEENSLHPEIPFRNSNYINSRDAILPAIDMLMSKGVVVSTFSDAAVKFYATELGFALYNQIIVAYKSGLNENILKAHEQIKHKTDESLNNLIYGQMADWGSEFSYESIFKGIEYEG